MKSMRDNQVKLNKLATDKGRDISENLKGISTLFIDRSLTHAGQESNFMS